MGDGRVQGFRFGLQESGARVCGVPSLLPWNCQAQLQGVAIRLRAVCSGVASRFRVACSVLARQRKGVGGRRTFAHHCSRGEGVPSLLPWNCQALQDFRFGFQERHFRAFDLDFRKGGSVGTIITALELPGAGTRARRRRDRVPISGVRLQASHPQSFLKPVAPHPKHTRA